MTVSFGNVKNIIIESLFMRVASFFSGIGGFDLGLERAGMELVFQCENNTFCRSILRKNWPTIPLHADIATLEAKHIPISDLWCAGFPCQDVSLANQGKRKGLKGERSGLFFKFAELVRERSPEWIIMENVPGLLNSQDGEDFRTVVRTLDELGYGVAWRILDAKFFGTPQRRRRVFLVASYRSASAAQVLFDDRPTAVSLRTSKSAEQNYSFRLRSSDTEANLYTIQHASIGRNDKAGPQAKGYRNDGETWNLDSRGSSDALCSTNDAFRIREASGVSQGMDGSTQRVDREIQEAENTTGEGNKETQVAGNVPILEADSNRFRSVGNAVAVPVIEWIGQRILQVETQEMHMETWTPSVFYPEELPLQMELFI